MGKALDLTGQRFGRLIVIERAESRITPSGYTYTMWKCKCDCGNITTVARSSLISGCTKSCGCLLNEISNKEKYEDLTGQHFGRLTVLEKADNYITPKGKKRARWLCQCECGNSTIVLASCLKNGSIQSCGCLHKETVSQLNGKNLIGQKFGRLTVVSQNKNYTGSEKILCWHCVCDCGNECDVVSRNLLSGNTKSCGCYKKDKMFESHFKDLTNQRFGKLTVIKRAEDYIKSNGIHKTMWLCQCDCGNQVEVLSHSLISHKTISCGCVKSVGEYNVNIYLSSMNITYRSQMKYKELVGVGNSPLLYDFYLPDYNILIECQGQQHEKPNKYFGGEEQFKIQQEHDRRKREYAEKNNIKLLEIWYYDYDRIDEILNKELKGNNKNA